MFVGTRRRGYCPSSHRPSSYRSVTWGRNVLSTSPISGSADNRDALKTKGRLVNLRLSSALYLHDNTGLANYKGPTSGRSGCPHCPLESIVSKPAPAPHAPQPTEEEKPAKPAVQPVQ
jgi:hypothetical protein